MGSFLTYCTQSEINDFKDNLNYIPTLIDREGQITSLEITKHIFKIYVNIKVFLAKEITKPILAKFRDFLILIFRWQCTTFSVKL